MCDAFEEDVRIDEMALDVELLRQPELVLKYGRMVVDAEFKVKGLKLELDALVSKLTTRAYQYPKKCFGNPDKPTVRQIEAYIKTHKKHMEISKELFEAEKRHALLLVVRNDIDFSKRESLKNLVSLHMSEYFGGPDMPRDIGEAAKKYRKSQQKRVNKKTKVK